MIKILQWNRIRSITEEIHIEVNMNLLFSPSILIDIKSSRQIILKGYDQTNIKKEILNATIKVKTFEINKYLLVYRIRNELIC